MKHIEPMLAVFLLTVAGCTDASKPPAPVSGAAKASTPRVTYAPLEKAIALWRGQEAITGDYRSVQDAAAAMGRTSKGSGRGTMLQIAKGTFAYGAPDRFRVTGTQSVEYPKDKKGLKAMGEIDLLFSGRTLTIVSKSSTRIPATAQVTRLGAKLFEEGSPFKLKTTLQGSPFGQSDIAGTVEALALFARFDQAQPIKEDGEALTAHLGQLNPEAAVNKMIADRSLSFATLVQALEKPDMKDSLLDLQLRSIAQGLLSQRHARVLVDDKGWIRGWDVGPTPDFWAFSLRMKNIRPSAAKDAFTLDASLLERAVDQTPALAAQTEDLQKAFDDDKAVAKAKGALLKKIEELASGSAR